MKGTRKDPVCTPSKPLVPGEDAGVLGNEGCQKTTILVLYVGQGDLGRELGTPPPNPSRPILSSTWDGDHGKGGPWRDSTQGTGQPGAEPGFEPVSQRL